MLASASFASGVLTVNGTSANDIISVREVNNDGFLRVYSAVDGRDIFIREVADSTNRIRINGGAGNDRLINRTGIPSGISGGNGNDFIIGGTGNDVLAGGNGADTILGDFADTGTVDAGDGGDDRIWGGSGNDRVDGKGGNDQIFGGDGNDNLSGGADNDKIFGNVGVDVISGNDGDDELSGGNGNEDRTGGVDKDYIFGGLGDDLLRGEWGNDFLSPGEGLDTAEGGQGNDLLLSNDVRSSNTLIGGLGNDVYRFTGDGLTGTDRIEERGSEGTADRINVQALRANSYNFNLNAANVFSYSAGPGIVRQVIAQPSGNIEQVVGPREAPTLSASAAGNGFGIAVTDRVGVNLSRSSGIVTVRLVGQDRRGQQLVISNVRVVPVSKVQTGATTAAFSYRLPDAIASRFGQIFSVQGVAEAGSFVDNHFNTIRTFFS